MRIFLLNGGSTPEFSVDFKKCVMVRHSEGELRYYLTEDDLPGIARSTLTLGYSSEFQKCDCDKLKYYISYAGGESFFYTADRTDNKVRFKVELTNEEQAILKRITTI